MQGVEPACRIPVCDDSPNPVSITPTSAASVVQNVDYGRPAVREASFTLPTETLSTSCSPKATAVIKTRDSGSRFRHTTTPPFEPSLAAQGQGGRRSSSGSNPARLPGSENPAYYPTKRPTWEPSMRLWRDNCRSYLYPCCNFLVCYWPSLSSCKR